LGLVAKKNTELFLYYDVNNKKRHYIPDFILLDDNNYIEVKGYKNELDDYKWKYFPYTLKILFKKDLQEIGALV
jgi:hypothetical protein